MNQRVWTLARYLFSELTRSVTGLLYILSAAAFWWIAYNPRAGQVPEPDAFILLVGIYGLALAFLATLSIATKANSIESAPFLPRLPSRVEYLAAVLLAVLLFVFAIQGVLGIVIMVQPAGPEMGWLAFMNVLPVWISADIFATVLALHATDFVMRGWSRVAVYATLAALLFSQSIDTRGLRWISDRLNGFASFLTRQQFNGFAQSVRNGANWMTTNGKTFFEETVGFVFWPFEAISQAAQNGFFSRAQALAPAILLLYATILFMLAADFFATKDMQLTEG